MNSIDSLIAKLLAPLDGYKTKLGAWTLAFLAANQVVPMVGTSIGQLLFHAAIALVAYGLRDAIAKQSPSAAR